MNKVATQKEIKNIAENNLKIIEAKFDWAFKDYLSRYFGAISDLRKFVEYIITISIAIVGVIIPILLNSEVLVIGGALASSALLFSIEILFGISIRFFVLKKDLSNWPKEWKKVEDKHRQTQDDLRRLINNPDINSILKTHTSISDRYKEDPQKISRFSKFFNPDYWFFGLFILAFTLFLISLYPAIFFVM